jgi:hypothetical protein
VNPSTYGPAELPSLATGSCGDLGHDGYVVGVDFGTLSARAVVVRVSDGFEIIIDADATMRRHGVDLQSATAYHRLSTILTGAN